MAKKYLDDTGMTYFWGKLKDYFQAKLVSGTNIKTINSESVLGSGDISLIDIFYPVGSYYETSDTSFDPNTSWGGTWSLEAEGLVHIGAGSTYTAGDTGGSADAIVPYHKHSVDAITSGTPSNNTSGTPSNNTSGTPSTNTSGGMSANETHTHKFGNYADGALNAGSIRFPLFWNATQNSGTSIKSTSVAHTHSLQNHTHSLQNHTHTLSSHTHSVGAHDTNYEGTSGNTVGANMQPYVVVNRWHRTA